MKKILLALFTFSLFFFSCEKKETETATLSGLLPSKFEYQTEEGQTNQLYVMKNAKGAEVTVMNIGARIVSVMVPDKAGDLQNVVLGHDNIEPYLQLNNTLGAVSGRYSGRIANGEFMLDRVTYRLRQNDGKNTLNGGPRGFSSRYFTVEQPNEQTLVCSYFSKAEENGFPGNLNLSVTYTLTEDNAISVGYEATTSRATVVNFTNQSYFNLSGKEAKTLGDYSLYIDASKYTPTKEDLIPTGEIKNVKGAFFDFTSQRAIDANETYDLNYVVNKPGDISNLVAKLVSSSTGISMEVYSTEPGLQLSVDKENASFALNTQHFPDSPNQPNFPTTVLRVDSVFNSQTIYKFGIEN